MTQQGAHPHDGFATLNEGAPHKMRLFAISHNLLAISHMKAQHMHLAYEHDDWIAVEGSGNPDANGKHLCSTDAAHRPVSLS